MLSPFSPHPQNPLLYPPFPCFYEGVPSPIPPIPTSPPSHSSILGHWSFTGPRASPPIDAWQGHSLLYRWLKPWFPPCLLSGWWFSPWELWSGWLILLFLHWSPQAQSDDWLQPSASILVRLWQRLSRHSHTRLPVPQSSAPQSHPENTCPPGVLTHPSSQVVSVLNGESNQAI